MRIFFENPWIDAELPSWVAEDESGIVGFIGILPRPMQLGNQKIRAAVATQFMVAPTRRGLAGAKLLLRAFGGSQDFLFTDVVTPQVTQMWLRAGGVASPLYRFRWSKRIRPVRYAMSRMSGGVVSSVVRGAAYHVLRGAEVLRRKRPAVDGSTQPLSPQSLIEMLARLTGLRRLIPVYTPESAAFVLDAIVQKWSPYLVRLQTVLDADERPLGWFIYTLIPGGVAQVLQVAASAGREKVVLQHLLADAYRAGAVAVTGRMEPLLLDGLGAIGASFAREGSSVLMHANDPRVAVAMLEGDAILGALEGEWWLDF